MVDMRPPFVLKVGLNVQSRPEYAYSMTFKFFECIVYFV